MHAYKLADNTHVCMYISVCTRCVCHMWRTRRIRAYLSMFIYSVCIQGVEGGPSIPGHCVSRIWHITSDCWLENCACTLCTSLLMGLLRQHNLSSATDSAFTQFGVAGRRSPCPRRCEWKRWWSHIQLDTKENTPHARQTNGGFLLIVSFLRIVHFSTNRITCSESMYGTLCVYWVSSDLTVLIVMQTQLAANVILLVLFPHRHHQPSSTLLQILECTWLQTVRI